MKRALPTNNFGIISIETATRPYHVVSFLCFRM
jgi:hypothetical protein